MEESIKKLLVTVDEGIQLMGKRENDMKIRCVNDFRAPFVHPDLFFDSLAVRAVAVTAGIVVYLRMTAILTDA